MAGASPGGVWDGPETSPGEGVELAPAPEARDPGPPANRSRAVAPREASNRRGSVRIPEQYCLQVVGGGDGTRCTLKGP